jgi:hypothetical protein
LIVGYTNTGDYHASGVKWAFDLNLVFPEIVKSVKRYPEILYDWTVYSLNHDNEWKPHNYFIRSLHTKRKDKVRDIWEPLYLAYLLIADKEDSSTWQLHLVNGRENEDGTGKDIKPDILNAEVYNFPFGVHEQFDLFAPEINIKVPKTMDPNSFEYIELKLEHGQDTYIYLKCDNGYLPKRKIKTKDGYAKVKISSLGLDSGDSITIKAGFKFFSGRNEATVRIK